MTNNDAQLIQQTLEGDQSAFSTLVRKYQKPLHALVWRKIGDFHIAEEITQDIFLNVYKKLRDAEKSESVCWMAVCDCHSPMSRLVEKETDPDEIVRCDAARGIRGAGLRTISR